MKQRMRNLLKRIRIFSLYRKLVISFLIISVVFALFISLLLYMVFDHFLKREMQYLSQSGLVEADSALTQTYEYLFPFVSDVLSLPYIDSALYGQNINRLHEFHILNELRRLQGSYPQISSIALVNLSNERQLGTTGVATGYDPALRAALEGDNDRGMYSVQRKSPRNINIQGSLAVDVISFVYHPSGIYSNGIIVIDMEEAYFEQLLNPIGVSASNQVFILTAEGHQVGGGNAGEELSLPEDMTAGGYILQQVDGQECMITTLASDITGWRLVRVMPVERMSPFAETFRGQLALVIGLLALVALGVSALLITRLYNPVKSMVNRYAGESGLENQDGRVRVDEFKLLYGAVLENRRKAADAGEAGAMGSIWIKGLLRGEPDALRQAAALERDGARQDDRYCVAVLCVDGKSRYDSVYGTGEQGLLDFAIANMLGELLADYLVENVLRMDEDVLAMLLRLPGEIPPHDLLLGLREFQGYLAKYFGLSASVGLGVKAAGWGEIHQSYETARQALEERFYAGPGQLLEASSLQPKDQRPEYPYGAEKKLLEALLLRSEPRLQKAAAAFVQAVAVFDRGHVRGYSEQCINNLRHNLAEKGVLLPKDESLHLAVTGAENLAELETVLQGRLAAMLEWAENASAAREADSHPVAFAKGYIDEHFGDPNLSVEHLADLVGLSPAYFGKLFSNAMNQSCVDYIMELRMEEAARLLRQTRQTARSISEAVGLSSTNYFYLLFKKKYGVTPMQYRKDHVG